MKVSEIIGKVKEAPAYVKAHWNTPAEGEYLSLKEIAAYTASQAGTYIYATAGGLMTFSASYFCGSIMGIAAMDFYLINLVSTIINYVLMFMNPISMLIYENHGRLSSGMRKFAHISYIGEILAGAACYFIPMNTFDMIMPGLPQLIGNILLISGVTNYITWFIRRKFCAKYGRVKPFIVICAIPSAILVSIIPFLPVEGLSYSYKLIVLHGAFSLMNYFYNSFIGVNGLVTFMTPNSQERQKLHSIVPIITGLFPSIINMFFPFLISITGGYLNITTYKVFIPIFAGIGALISLCAIFCKERVIEENIEKRKKVKFFEGAKNALKNKYLWMLNIANVVGQWQWLMASILDLWFIYLLRTESIMGIAKNLVVIGMTAGNILCPILTAKFQKRDILLVSKAVALVILFGALFAVKSENLIIYLILMFLRNTIQPVETGIALGLGADIQNYHHWKYGERSDSVSGVFSWFLNPINMGLGYLLPWVLELCGFTSDWDVYYDSTVLNNVFYVYIWGAIISTALFGASFIFYDLTKEKHDMCVKELKERLEKAENEESEEQAV
ncbi:MAG: MFS transporter [Clostridia bacterium]|nr:MFS transporter [Clostridia bacterium]